MADPKKPDGGSDRQKLMTLLVPAGAAAVVVILVAVILGVSDSGPAPSDKEKDKGKPGAADNWIAEASPTTARSDLTKMSDGSDPTAEDKDLKDGPEGLKYSDLKVGTGPAVPPGAFIKVHYTGWLTNGTKFDSSVARGQPAEFSLDGVVRGWTIGIPEMRVGGVRKLVIPPELGYGSRGQRSIPPNSTLIFEVEVLAIR